MLSFFCFVIFFSRTDGSVYCNCGVLHVNSKLLKNKQANLLITEKEHELIFLWFPHVAFILDIVPLHHCSFRLGENIISEMQYA